MPQETRQQEIDATTQIHTRDDDKQRQHSPLHRPPSLVFRETASRRHWQAFVFVLFAFLLATFIAYEPTGDYQEAAAAGVKNIAAAPVALVQKWAAATTTNLGNASSWSESIKSSSLFSASASRPKVSTTATATATTTSSTTTTTTATTACTLNACQERYFTQGAWQHNPTRPRLENQYALSGHMGAQQREFRQSHPDDLTQNIPLLEYDWVVQDVQESGGKNGQRHEHSEHKHDDIYGCCPEVAHPVFDADAFCQVLQVLQISSLMFVGDSINQQMAQSLFLMVEGRRQIEKRNRGEAMDWDPYNVANVEHFPEAFGGFMHDSTPWLGTLCDGKANLTLVRNDLLYVNETRLDNETPEKGPYEYPEFWEWHFSQPWTPLVKERHADLLVVNTGAHVHHEDVYDRLIDALLAYLSNDYLKEEEEETQQQPRRDQQQQQQLHKHRVVFRSTNPGHPDCMNYTGPTDPQKVWDFSGVPPEFSWDLFPGYNNRTKTQFEKLLPGQYAWLDTATLTRDRPDGRTGADDCLHYTGAGPVDFWNVALLHLLETEQYFLLKEKVESSRRQR